MPKVLYVDDDIIVGETIVSFLKMQGFDVQFVTSFDALEVMMRSFMPDVVLLDLEVGNSNGIDEMARLRSYASNVPVIFISSHVDGKYAMQAVNAGAEVYLRKPVDCEELYAYINKVLPNECNETQNAEVKLGQFTFDLINNKLNDADRREVHLTKNERLVLGVLAQNVGKVVARDVFYDKIWPDGNASYDSLNNYVSHLRTKLCQNDEVAIIAKSKEGFMLSLECK